jgi:hypothetical protein
MSLNNKDFYKVREDAIALTLSTGVPTQHDLYYVQAIQADILRERRRDELRKMLPEIPNNQ